MGIEVLGAFGRGQDTEIGTYVQEVRVLPSCCTVERVVTHFLRSLLSRSTAATWSTCAPSAPSRGYG
jgi:hypothetical protein